MLKEFPPVANPLAVFNMRRLDFCPPHFETITFDIYVSEKEISDWIYENTEGRFFLGKVVKATPAPPPGPGRDHRWSANITRDLSQCAGFEVHSEASFFTLLLSQINKRPDYQL